MDLSVLRRNSETDNLETTELAEKEPKLSYSIASLLQTVQRAKAAPALEREEKNEENEESDEESEISVDSNPDTSEDDRLAVSKDEEDPEEQQNSPPLLDLRLGVPPHLLPPGLPLPLQGLLPPGWPGLHHLLNHPAINNQHRHHPGNLTPHTSHLQLCPVREINAEILQPWSKMK